MSLRAWVDWRSAPYLLVAAAAVGFLWVGPRTPLAFGVYGVVAVVFAGGALVPVRERVPEYDRTVGVVLGLLGVYGLATNGVSVVDGLLVLAGVVSVLVVVYERVTGRSVRFA